MIRTVAGLDCAFFDGKAVAVAVLCTFPDMKPVHTAAAVLPVRTAYTPGYLFYREGKALLVAYHRLQKKPDIVLIDGHGIAHPRFFGEASHIGLHIRKPTIGIAKKLLSGRLKGKEVFIGGRPVAHKLKNIYVSPGHRISHRTAVRIVKLCMRGHRLPEPLFLAHQAARKLAKDQKKA